MELIIIILILILPLIANAKVKSNYKKYSKINNSLNMTGKDAARKILDNNGLNYISINKAEGDLTDHYDPRNKTINLSSASYDANSVAAVAIAAHECGHAIQDKEAYAFLRFRTALVPAVNFSSKFSTIAIIIGFAAGFLSLVEIGIALLCVGLLFQLITLPVEFNASSRAKKQLEKNGLVAKNDTKGTKKVLKAAALTYVASFLVTALNILRLILVSRNRN